MSQGTFHSALGSALLDHVNPTSGEEPSGLDGGMNMGRRTDSGFAENASLADESSAGGTPDDTVSVKTLRQRHEVCQNDSLRSKPKKRSSRSTADNQHKSTPSSARSNSRDHRKSKTPSSSRASSNHRPTRRRNSSSMTPASTRTSRPSCKRSARSSCYSRPPTVPLQSSSSTLPHRHAHNPFALHYKSCQLFQSIGTPTIAYQEDITAASAANGHSLTGNNSIHSPDGELDEEEDFDPHPIPRATITDWTSPSTRRREYARIDRNSRGLRGWWRRNAPGWCFKGCRAAGFYDAERDSGSDAGSVRRYRLELPDDEDDDAINLVDEKSGGDDKVKARSMGRSRGWLGRTWSGFSRKRACKGEEEGEASRKTWW
ncbi:MAG: hypothetical protein M1835_006872 [Candelina submexicana]|nr:MAG: hypothetical protein M1835_006872 [Candelina submexicana]